MVTAGLGLTGTMSMVFSCTQCRPVGDIPASWSAEAGSRRVYTPLFQKVPMEKHVAPPPTTTTLPSGMETAECPTNSGRGTDSCSAPCPSSRRVIVNSSPDTEHSKTSSRSLSRWSLAMPPRITNSPSWWRQVAPNLVNSHRDVSTSTFSESLSGVNLTVGFCVTVRWTRSKAEVKNDIP
jgi:hypothetical protein